MAPQTRKAYSYIRFSTPKQKEGDSLRRQIEAADKYANDNGLELDKSVNMHDEGLSGFTGKHIDEGNLGKFLALIEAGKISPGSRLIIESIDRLGRQEPLTATDVIKLILRAKIMLVVLDWYQVREFTHESIRNNPGEYSGLVAEIERAYFESKKKSERISDTWKEKRKMADKGKIKLTPMSPLWLEPVKNDKGVVINFEPISEVVNAVNQIFILKANGIGNGSIAKQLNNDPNFWQPPKSTRNKTGGWATSTIQRYVHDRRVLGEYHPCSVEFEYCKRRKRKLRKRKPQGDPIPDYYPAIVEKELFYSVQNRMRRFLKKHGHPGGRANKASSVFTHVAHCGKCGSRMHHGNKGAKGKEGGYLRCSLALSGQTKNGITCNARSIYYTYFKKTFFNYVTEIKVSDILPNSDEHQTQIVELTKIIDANGERISELVQKEDTFIAVIEKEWSPEAHDKLKNQLESVITERQALVELNQKLLNQRMTLEKQVDETQGNLNTLNEVQKLEESAKTKDEAVEIRLKIRAKIKQLVDLIEIYPSDQTTGKFDMVKVWFHGSHPHAHLLTFTSDGWRKLTRMNTPRKTA